MMAKAKNPHIDPNESFRQAMTTLIGARWQAVWEAIPVAIEGVDPEGVHDVRVASRRLRAAMDVAADLYPLDWYRPLHKTAKNITSELGEVRDRDVLLEWLDQEIANAEPGEQLGIERLVSRITSERDAARQAMLEYLTHLEDRDIRGQADRRFPSVDQEPDTEDQGG